MKYQSKVVWCLCLLLAGLGIVAVMPHIAHAATRCEACKGTGRDICEFCGGVGCAQCNWKGGKYDILGRPASCRYCGGVGVIYTAAEKAAMEKEKAKKAEEKRAWVASVYAEDNAKIEAARASRGTFTDSRDGKSYKTIKLDSQTWMAENLNYDVTKTIHEKIRYTISLMVPDTIYTNNKKKKIKAITEKEVKRAVEKTVEKTVNANVCYDNDPANCETYGSLYDWNTAMMACPVGWHLPSDAEWNVLVVDYAGGGSEARNALLSTGDWKYVSGTDKFGFSALPGGYYDDSEGNFYSAGKNGYWWTAREVEADRSCAYFRYTYTQSAVGSVDRNNDKKTNLYSVRCVQD